MGKPRDDVRTLFEERKDKSVDCKYCKTKYKFINVNKMKNHILKCMKCPCDVKAKFKTSSSRSSHSDSSVMSTASASSLSASTPRQQEMEECDLSKRTRLTEVKQFVDSMNPTENENLNDALAKAIFASGTPLSIVEHPLWKQFFNMLRPAYTLPSRKSISTTFLDNQYAVMKHKLEFELQNSENLNLQCDGWSNIRNEAIMNFIVTKPEPVFTDFVNTKAHRHTAEYLEEKISEVIEKYGSEKFFCVIGDNAANMQKSFKRIQERYTHIIPLGCLAHTFHLLCRDILKGNSIQEFMEKLTALVKKIKSVHVLNALFIQIDNDKKSNVSLKLPGATSWGSSLACLESFKKSKMSLQHLAVDEEASKELPADMKRNLLDDLTFWPKIDSIIRVLKPIVEFLDKFQTKGCIIHKVCEYMTHVEVTLKGILPETGMNENEVANILDSFTKRKEHALKPLHFAAALVDPSTQGSHLTQQQQIDAMEFIHKVATDMKIDSQENVMADLANYRAKHKLWSKSFLRSGIGITGGIHSTSPVSWGRGLCGTRSLSKIAVRILTAPNSSAETERSVSTFSFVHNKRRNRLTTERAGKITYISHNWKINFESTKLKPQTSKPSTSGFPQADLEPQSSTSSVTVGTYEYDNNENDSESFGDLETGSDSDTYPQTRARPTTESECDSELSLALDCEEF